MPRRPTIHDVARHAGVGAKTVSRVLNGERAVSESMRARVQASIRTLGYRPNSAARMLRKDLTRSIGFVCADIAEPVQAQLARAIETVARDHDSAVTVSLTDHEPDRERDAIESLTSRRVDGLILWPTGIGSRYLARLVRDLPTVCVDRPIDGVETDTVLCDNRQGVREAIELLHRRGHRRIAFVGDDPELFTQAERYDGYRRTLADHGLPVDAGIVVRGNHQVPRLRRQLAHWRAAPAPPTAILAASSVAAHAVIRAVDADDPVTVLAFDDFPLADVIRGGISVVSQNVDDIGRAAAEMLFDRLAGDQRGPNHLRIPTTMIARGNDHEHDQQRS
ncbi:LacI family DNA-binding transcriptional regulator [Microlunatus soli]|uniref:Transcriptional regulator, LacI family n=1 Tax=Microlunatus soli TaxID=630515 RepID=A0A1H1NUB8_9ACTN|nr:LacI family DNA-binding transcriptional regulator [Microlunatus soli]SDS02533.1 transcriptional regulator, LacI family [Microlunatus soli]